MKEIGRGRALLIPFDPEKYRSTEMNNWVRIFKSQIFDITDM